MKALITPFAVTLGLTLLGPVPVLGQDLDASGTDVVDRAEELGNAKETVIEAAAVIEQMKADEDAPRLLEQAKAVFIVPDYARGSLIAGAAGGQGVLVAQTDDGWSGPAFYNIGAVNVGAAAGFEAGSVAFLLMTDDAMDGFDQTHNFALNADAGLTIFDWTERAQIAAGKGADVVVWSDTEGLYGDLAISVSDIFWDEQAHAAYYGQAVAPDLIIVGEVSDPMSDSQLRSEFSALEERSPSGEQGTGQGAGASAADPAASDSRQ